jgi:chemotaxis methyl-accepting protein methylase
MHGEHLAPATTKRLCELIYNKAGIHLGPDRKTMLGARINRRLKALNLPITPSIALPLWHSRAAG